MSLGLAWRDASCYCLCIPSLSALVFCLAGATGGTYNVDRAAGAAPMGSLSVAMNTEDFVDLVRQVPLFLTCNDQALREVLKTAQLRPVSAGQVVFKQGDLGDKFYIVYSGRIRILTIDRQKREISLGVMARGDHFGETALITEGPRTATARAVEDSVLLVLDRGTFEQQLMASPEQREYFDRFIRSTSIHRFLKSCTDLSCVPAAELRELVRSFKLVFCHAGEAVFRQGAEPDAFYLIERGKAKVVRWENGQPEIIGFLHEGNFFGEKALYEKTVRYADVICLTDCHLFSLSKQAFDAMLKVSAQLRAVIEDRIRFYAEDKPPIPYRELIKQELAAQKLGALEEPTSEDPAAPGEQRKPRFRKLASFWHRQVRFPLILQYDEMSCGTTCLMMIARYYGKSFSSSRLRDLAHVDQSGASLANVATAAEQVGFSTRAMRLTYAALQSVHHPSIIHWQGYHFVVVHRVNEKYVWVADPAIGLRKYSQAEFRENWNGVTLTLEPTPEFEAAREDRSSCRNFLQFVTPHKWIFLEILLATLLLNVFGLAMPLFTQNVVDNVLGHNSVSMLNMMLLGMVLVLVFRALLGLVREYLIAHTSMRIDLRMLVVFYKHILDLPLGYFKVRRIGDFITRFAENQKIRNFFAETAVTLVLDALMIVVYVSLMFYYDVSMTLLTLLLLPLVAGITLAFTPVLRRLFVDSFKAATESESHLIESISGIETVKAMNTEYPTRWKWEEKLVKSLNIDFRLFKTAMWYEGLAEFVGALCPTVILWYGARQVMQGALSVGELMAFMVLVGNVLVPTSRVMRAWDKVQQVLVSVNRLNDVFAARPEFPESMEDARGLVVHEPRGEIAFENIYFRYGGHDDPYILSGLNLRIQAGQTVAIVGRSGSGKSTLVKLIARFYDATEGRITLDGCDIRNINLADLRNLVGFVLQDSFLFSGTVRENISLGDPRETTARIVEAAKLANAHDFITSLPMGYDTKIGESGLQLSGGQRQRIAIARALYRNPRILVLDEATNSLDTESERAIQQSMKTIRTGRTAFIIAHRLSTIRNADLIVVLDNGEIVEQGTHEQLMERKGLYHYLNHQQFNLVQ